MHVRAEGMELQVKLTNNEHAVGFYKHLGAREVARVVDGLVVGEGSWRTPRNGWMMMRVEAATLDAALQEGRHMGTTGHTVLVADSLEELREAGVLEPLRAAAAYATRDQPWHPAGKHLPCLREGGDGMGCRYVVVMRDKEQPHVNEDEEDAGEVCERMSLQTTFARRNTLTKGKEVIP